MADLDILSGASFDDLYAKSIKPELTLREADRKKAMGTFGLIMLAGVLLVAIEALLLGPVVVRAPQIWIMTLVLAGVLAYLPLARVAKAAKVDVINALVAPLGVSYQLGGFEPAGWQQFLDLHLLPTPTSAKYEDRFTGQRAGGPFEICEATLTQGSGRNRSTVFRGQLFRLAFPRHFSGVTVVLRNAGWFSRFECPQGLSKVGLEDPVFNHSYAVFGSDQVEARAILTPAFMEQLTALETAYSGANIRYAFAEGDLLIALEGKDRFEIGGMFSTLVSRDRVDSIAHDLAAVFTLIDSFCA